MLQMVNQDGALDRVFWNPLMYEKASINFSPHFCLAIVLWQKQIFYKDRFKKD